MSSVKQLAAWNSSSSAKLSPGAFLSVNLTACSTWSTASLCSPRTLDGDKQWQLPAGVVWSHLLPLWSMVQSCWPSLQEPRQESRDSADKIYTIMAPRVGPVGDHNFHGATGGTFSVTSALSMLLRLARRELDETNTWHTEGIQSLGLPGTPLVESASRCTAQAFLQAGAWSCGLRA